MCKRYSKGNVYTLIRLCTQYKYTIYNYYTPYTLYTYTPHRPHIYKIYYTQEVIILTLDNSCCKVSLIFSILLYSNIYLLISISFIFISFFNWLIKSIYVLLSFCVLLYNIVISDKFLNIWFFSCFIILYNSIWFFNFRSICVLFVVSSFILSCNIWFSSSEWSIYTSVYSLYA